jgi:hypothetical protein
VLDAGRMMLKLSLLTTSLLAITGSACAVDDLTPATTAEQTLSDPCPAGTPASIAPAANADLAFAFDAEGIQRYACVATATGFAWSFVAPDAALFADHTNTQVMHHFAGPTWEYQDGSSVVAAKAAGNTVDPTAIAWLLLNVVSHAGPDGRMTDITQIQRLETAGGLAPTVGCDAEHVGAGADVPYTARYFFYRPTGNPSPVRCGG